MGEEFNTALHDRLMKVVNSQSLHKKYYPKRYSTGDVLETEIQGIVPDKKARVRFEVERFIGGGFAGQVYRVRVLGINGKTGKSGGVATGKTYAVKLAKPPSGFALSFRNILFRLAYQGPFAPQLSHAAARSGVLWQKIIRRGMRTVFGTETAAVDTFGTFFDSRSGTWGELNEWVEGRNWKFEIDDSKFDKKRRERPSEYLDKKRFMKKTVVLCHEMGAHEFARQYEWWTMKSQPNVLKRLRAKKGNGENHTAIDFKAGLVLLPFLPMSPADVKLIFEGAERGNFVQFDRGNIKTLERFVLRHRKDFQDLTPVLQELRKRDFLYRSSLPDLSHHGILTLADPVLGRNIVSGLLECWRNGGRLDDAAVEKAKHSPLLFLVFYFLDFVPFGKRLLRLAGNKNYRMHLESFIRRKTYRSQTLHAILCSHLVDWQRDGRASDERIERLIRRPLPFWLQTVFLGWLPAKWHRFFVEPAYAWDRVKHVVTYPLKLYFNTTFRERWILDMVKEGREDGMLTFEEERFIVSRLKEPYIQIYLKALAVHMCTLPISEIIYVIIAIFAMIRFGNNFAESIAYAAAILVSIQFMPISPGSMIRGGYVVYLMVRDRDIKGYWIAALVSIWRNIGYLGFPLQMVTRYPLLSRFMAGRWATRAVNVIPVFGERGALLEHAVFDLFFNVPISLRKWLRKGKNTPIGAGERVSRSGVPAKSDT